MYITGTLPDTTMTVSSIGLILLIIGFSSGFLLYYSNSRLLAKGVRLPGPKPSFFAGNVHQLPRLEPWKTFAAWGKIYGKLFYSLISSDIVLNSYIKVQSSTSGCLITRLLC